MIHIMVLTDKDATITICHYKIKIHINNYMAKSKIRQLAEFDFYTKSESDGKVVE